MDVNTLMNRYRIACVDSRRFYSPNLAKEINLLDNKFVFFIYLPSYINPRSYKIGFENSPIFFENVWTPYFFPFQIFKRAVNDGIRMIHIQWELNSFGQAWSRIAFIGSCIFPLLLLLLKVARIKIIITVHSVVSKSDILSKDFEMRIPKPVSYTHLTLPTKA